MKSWLDFVRSHAAARRARPAPKFRPTVEQMEERMVPAVVDLTTAGAQGVINNALFQQTATQPTGSGVIHSFVRLFGTGNAAVEQGFNTDARPLQYNENNSPVFTRSLQLSEVPIVQYNGVSYREFLLDINQKHSSPLVSLDELRIYVGNAPNLVGYDPNSQQLAGLSATYDLGGTSVLLNAALSHGSGSGDMYLLVPDAQLTAAGGNYIYLYSKFGATVSANGGYEEWAVQGQNNQGSLSGYVYFDQNQSGTFNTGDSGIPDVLVTLTGQDNQGNVINWSQWTDATGFYIFSGLQAGNYSITETAPPNYTAYMENLGTAGGTAVGNTQFINIVLDAGVIGRDYDFGNILNPTPAVS
jgi:hypothetical protein